MTTDPLIGTEVKDKYRVVGKLGAGAMGTVYEAEHTSLKRRVALKILHRDLNLSEETLQRFQQEGVAAGRIRHANAIEIFDFDKTEDGLVFLAMEFVEGRSLKKMLLDDGALPPEQAVAISIAILECLEAAHAVGIVHRDLKPENIMVHGTEAGENRVKVLDFGISKLVEGDAEAAMMTQTGRIMGTPQYMSPEQISGATIDHRCDLYSTGLILFEMVAGRPPFQGNTVTEILMKHSTEQSPPVRKVNAEILVPRDLERVLYRSLRKKREERYPDAAAMLADLRAIDWGKPARSGPSGRQIGIAAAGVLAVVLISFAVFATRPSDDGTGDEDRTAGVENPNTGSGTDSGGRVAGSPSPGGAAAGGASAERILVRDKPESERTSEESLYVTKIDEARRKLRIGDARGASQAAEEALAFACRDAEAYLVRGRVFLDAGDLEAARGDIDDALDRHPRYARAEAWRGRLELATGRPEKALPYFKRASDLDPDLAVAIEGLGMARYELGETETAREALEQAVALDRDLGEAHLYLGRILLETGDASDEELRRAEARDAFLRAKRANGRLVPAYEALGALSEEEGDDEDAMVQYRAALEIDPESVRALLGLAAVYIAQGRLEDAGSLLEDAVSLESDSGRAEILRATIQVERGDNAAAIRDLEVGLQKTPDAAAETALLGLLYEAEGRDDDAMSAYLSAVAIDDGLAYVWRQMGVLHAERSQYDDALAALEKAVELDPEDPVSRFALAALLKDAFGDTAGTREQLRVYRELGGTDSRALDWLDRNP